MADATVITGDFQYRDLVRRRGAKASEECWFAEPVPFRVAVAAPGELPVAIACALSSGTGAATVDAEYRAGPGWLLRAVGAPADLASARSGRSRLVHEQGEACFPRGRMRERLDWEDASEARYLNAKVVASGRDAALALAHGEAARCRVLDGRLLAPSAPPVLDVQLGGATILVRHVDGGRSPGPWSARFHVEDRDAAIAHAGWALAHPWVASLATGIAASAPALVFASPSRGEFVLAEAQDIVRRLKRTTWPGDFPGLDPTILESWARFRRHGEGVLEGDPEAIRPALDALADVLDRIPQIERPNWHDPTAAESLRHTLEEMVRHWRAYLRPLAPVPAPVEDVEAVAALAP